MGAVLVLGLALLLGANGVMPDDATPDEATAGEATAGDAKPDQATPDEATPAGDGRRELSLDGPWQIVFDEQNVGTQQGWQRADGFPRDRAEAIRVPSCWEETRQDYEGVAWYATTFRLPGEWRGRHVRVRFGAVNYRAEVWLNEQAVGAHEGGYTPFELDVAERLRFDADNVLVVRVVGPAVTVERVDDLVRNEAPHWRGAIAGGIWQSVALIATGQVTIRDVFVEPKLSEGKAAIHVAVGNTSRQRRNASIQLRVTDGEGREAAHAAEQAELAPGRHELHLPLTIERPTPWSPDAPHLYAADVRVTADGEAHDRVQTRFGFRELTIRDGSFLLNGEEVLLKCAFCEGLYPSTLAYPRDAGMVRREIRLAKAAGFNALRPWRKPPPPPILDLADEMGILVIDCPPIECMGHWPAVTPRLEEHVAIEVREMVLRDRNHPSVVCWELFNEILRPELSRLKQPMALLARSLDPTRLIVDESGGWADGAHAWLPYSAQAIDISEIHSYLRAPVDDWTYDFYATVGSPGAPKPRSGRSPIQPGAPLFVSEVGYGALPDLPRNCERYAREGNPITPDYRYHHAMLRSLEQCLDELELREAFPSASAFCLATQAVQAEGNKLQLEALRINPHVAGYCLHAFTGGDWVMGAGILDLWREPKRAYAAVAEVNAPLYLAIRARPRNAYAGQDVQVTVTAASELPKAEGVLVVQVASAAGEEAWRGEEARRGEEAWRGERPVAVGRGVHRLLDERVTLPAAGRYVVTAQLRDGGALLSASRYPILVVGGEALEPRVRDVVAVDPERRLERFCTARGIRCGAMPQKGRAGAPVLVAARSWPPPVRKQVARVLEDVEQGAVAIFLDLPGQKAGGAEPLLPFPVRTRPALGNWVPVAHAVRTHPVFDGLPQGCLMGQDYQGVCAKETLVGVEGETVVASISWDWRTEPLCYRGPGPFWWGSDLAVVPHGRGKLILSTLQLLDHLGNDPVADKVLLNLIAFARDVGRLPSCSPASRAAHPEACDGCPA